MVYLTRENITQAPQLIDLYSKLRNQVPIFLACVYIFIVKESLLSKHIYFLFILTNNIEVKIIIIMSACIKIINLLFSPPPSLSLTTDKTKNASTKNGLSPLPRPSPHVPDASGSGGVAAGGALPQCFAATFHVPTRVDICVAKG